MKVLVVEDEIQIAADITTSLAEVGFIFEVCGNGEDAWFLGSSEDYDAVILDLGLPQLDGLTVLRRWRSENRTMPVIILTARGAWLERVEGINAGADDYLVKPFQMAELIARLRGVLRRAVGQPAPTLAVGGLRLETTQKLALLDGKSVHLTPLEMRFLNYLMHHRGRIVSRDELREHIYGNNDARDVNALEAVLARIRRKIGGDIIETRRGHGYLVRASE